MKHYLAVGILAMGIFSCANKNDEEKLSVPVAENNADECEITIDQSAVVDTTVCPLSVFATDKTTGKYIYGLEVYLAYEQDTLKLVTDSAGYAGGYYGYGIQSIRVVREGYGECKLDHPEIDPEPSHCLQINVTMPGNAVN